MAQVARKILRFGRFTLDLSRGSLRDSDQDIELRPKAFEMLRYLAENAGRLVPKQELIDAVWPNVTVSDDSLVQCIRELRDKLGDGEHRLIKTVPRRGYLLDTIVAAPEANPVAADVSAVMPVADPSTVTPQASRSARGRQRWILAAVGVLAVALASFYVAERLWTPSAVPNSHSETASSTASAHPAFKDCETCPEMVALPAGEFMMGSPESEHGHLPVEGPPRHVTVTKPVAIGKYEVTIDQFSAYINDAGAPVSHQCRLIEPATFNGSSVIWGPPEASFLEPGYEPTGSHPVGCISWHDAEAYVAWLRRRTGKPYRLPTEAEWEYAARAGSTTSFSYGNEENELCDYARFADLASPFSWRGNCRSSIASYGPVAVGTLKPNAWGLFDMHGNVWEWVEDCWTPNPLEIPADASAVVRPGHCELGVVRGGSWAAGAPRVRSAFRLGLVASRRDHNLGFRVALTLTE